MGWTLKNNVWTLKKIYELLNFMNPGLADGSWGVERWDVKTEDQETIHASVSTFFQEFFIL